MPYIFKNKNIIIIIIIISYHLQMDYWVSNHNARIF